MKTNAPKFRASIFAAVVVLGFATSARCQEVSPLIGRWDITMTQGEVEFPAWLEVRKSGSKTLVGSFCGRVGSARPIGKITTDGDSFRFAIPPQWESQEDDFVVEGTLENDMLSGLYVTSDANIPWTAVRAPTLKSKNPVQWGEPIELIDDDELKGWKEVVSGNANHGWVCCDGVLINEKPGQNIATEAVFTDFKLHAEFRYPKGSNSGIYLRGRYEFQIEDSFGEAADSHRIGGIYGHLTPSSNAAKEHDQWQECDIELVGRKVTVHLNGERIIDRAEIPGITGGAIDSHESKPGPIYLQGDHGPIEFRKLTLIPSAKK